jgi:hypothetical protein
MSFVQGKTADAGSVSSTTLKFTNPVAAGNCLVTIVRYGSSTDNFTSIADDTNAGNWAAPVVNQNDSLGGDRLYVAVRPNTLSGTPTVTVTFSASSTVRWMIAEYSLIVSASAVDVSPSTDQGAAALMATQAATTTIANDILLGVIQTGNSGANLTVTDDAAFTNRLSVITSGGNNNVLDLSDRAVTTATTYSATWTLSLADFTATAIVALKTTGSTTKPYPPFQLGVG